MQVPIVSTITLQGVQILEDKREEIEGIQELFAPLNILVIYTSRQQVDDSKTESNEYEWGLDHLSDTPTTETPEESSDIIDETQEEIYLKLQK